MEADQEFGEKETYLHGPELRTAQSDLHLTCSMLDELLYSPDIHQ